MLLVLRALGASDERIIDYFRTVSQGRKWVGGRIPFEVNIPDGMVIDSEDFIGSIELKFWTRLAKLSWRSFEEAREFAHNLGLRGESEWRKYLKGGFSDKGFLPEDIPSKPSDTYSNEGWISWGDWLGTGTVSYSLRKYRPFEKASAFVRSLGLRSNVEWRKYLRGEFPDKEALPEDIPPSPHVAYKGRGWTSWGRWLGTDKVAYDRRKLRPFTDAREYARSLALKNGTEWRKFCKGELPKKGKLPPDIPAGPRDFYKNQGWINWGDWLGTGNIAVTLRKFLPFAQARSFVQALKLKSHSDWSKYCRGKISGKGVLPEDIPTAPQQSYKNQGWISWGDWLGTGSVAPQLRKYRSFEEARAFVRNLGLKNQKEWNRYCRGMLVAEKGLIPQDIPKDPWKGYKRKGWISWGDWLGTGNVTTWLQEFWPFEQSRAFVQALKLKSQLEWTLYRRGELLSKGVLPKYIPSNPSRTYKGKGWVSWGDWLGTGSIAPQLRKYRPFEGAAHFARNLGLKSQEEWHRYCRGMLVPEKGIKPHDIPAKPWIVYKENGWISLGDWLGTGKVATFRMKYRSFEKARAFVHTLQLKNSSEWIKYCRGEMPRKGSLPEDIPVTA